MIDNTQAKLILLFVFEKAEIQLQDETIFDMCGSKNNWLPFMECKPALDSLDEAGFIINNTKGTNIRSYSITTDGRDCLKLFYTKIPSTLRDEIQLHIKDNLLNYRQKQEYFSDYYKNNDGTYTVVLKIILPSQQPALELKLNVPNRTKAKTIYKNWNENAPQLYDVIHELLIDNV